jgi:DNA-binding winged helix-turn-helix (wHTH) protein
MEANRTKEGESLTALGRSYQFGRFSLSVGDDGNMVLLSDEHAVALTTGELTILRLLLENRGRFVKTKELLDRVTQSPRASENLVHGAVRELRRTLHDADLIRTERTKGYCFTGEVKVTDPVENSVAREADSSVGLFKPSTQHSFPPDSHAQIVAPLANEPEPSGARRRDPFLIVALLVSAAVLLLPFGLAFAASSWTNVTKQLGFIQALMILVAIAYDFFLTSNPRAKDADTDARALMAVQQFRRSWRLLLASWCSLYITLLLSQELALSSGDATSQWQALQVVTTFLNNASALMLVLCYLVLNRPTLIRIAGRDVEDLPLKRGLFLVGAFGLLEAALVVYFENFGHADYARFVLFGADLLSGIVGGIAMALFISRLDSRLLGASRFLPVIPIVLYFYVVIQPFYPLLNWTFPLGRVAPQHFDLWIMQLAFMLKAVMYIHVTELVKSDRFLFYMICARRVYENVDTQWRLFKNG